MKRKKIITLLLLTGMLVSNSCFRNRDHGEDIEYNFSSEVLIHEEVVSGKKQILRIKLSSHAYNDGLLEHWATFTDDKESFLISPDENKIKSGERFSITNVEKYIEFNFYSEKIGIHNLKFTFTNSKGLSDNKEVAVLVGKGFFETTFKPPLKSVTVNTPTSVVYNFIPTLEELTDYELKFKTKSSNDMKLDARLNGHKANEWFNISKHEGKLSYTPISSGSHTVYVTARNKLGIERASSFLIVTHGNPVITSYNVVEEVSFILQQKDWYPGFSTYLFYSCTLDPLLEFSVYSGGDDLTISSISIGIRIDGKVPKDTSPMYVVEKDIISSVTNYSDDYLYLRGVNLSYGTKIEEKIEIINSAGLKTEMTIPIKIKDIKIEKVKELEFGRYLVNRCRRWYLEK